MIWPELYPINSMICPLIPVWKEIIWFSFSKVLLTNITLFELGILCFSLHNCVWFHDIYVLIFFSFFFSLVSIFFPSQIDGIFRRYKQLERVSFFLYIKKKNCLKRILESWMQEFLPFIRDDSINTVTPSTLSLYLKGLVCLNWVHVWGPWVFHGWFKETSILVRKLLSWAMLRVKLIFFNIEKFSGHKKLFIMSLNLKEK